jgi:hypothetical protein
LPAPTDAFRAVSSWNPRGALRDLGKLSFELAGPPLAEIKLYQRTASLIPAAPGDLLEPGGCRAGRSLFSNRAMEKGYGRWLGWLDSGGLLDAQIAPGDRITPDRVRLYGRDLEAGNASGTVIARIIELKVMAAVMDPEKDWSWIYRFASAVRIRHKQPDRSGIVSSTHTGC